MPTKVVVKVTQPDDPTVSGLHIFESANPTGPFVEIANIVVPPGQVLESVDVDATLGTDWFASQWKDAQGAWLTPLSPPVKAGDSSFVELVIDRVMQRDRSLDRDIVRQEVEAAVEFVFNKNPYGVSFADIPSGQQYRRINGIVYLAMARSYIAASSSSSNVQSATLGLVSLRTESGTQRTVDVQHLIDLANLSLGISTSLVLQMEDVTTCDRWWQVTEP